MIYFMLFFPVWGKGNYQHFHVAYMETADKLFVINILTLIFLSIRFNGKVSHVIIIGVTLIILAP